jgi:Phosphotransferase enzyme family
MTAAQQLDRETIARRLAALPRLADFHAAELVPMPAKGTAHRHYRLAGRGLVLRALIHSPWAAADALAYEAAGFRRAEPSAATPRLAAVLPAGAGLPCGALLVEEIEGRPPRLPAELPAIATALARLHSLPVPPAAARPPLVDHAAPGPVAATLALVERQLAALGELELPAATRAALADELAAARRFAAALPREAQPVRLVGSDVHPGNFVIRPDGAAAFVDLERMLYGSPAIDLAHASLYSSTTWDEEVDAALSPAEVAAFEAAYLARIDEPLAAALQPLLRPSRRLAWLRTMSWCARWLAADRRGEAPAADGERARRVRERISDFFVPATIARVRAEWLNHSS